MKDIILKALKQAPLTKFQMLAQSVKGAKELSKLYIQYRIEKTLKKASLYFFIQLAIMLCLYQTYYYFQISWVKILSSSLIVLAVVVNCLIFIRLIPELLKIFRVVNGKTGFLIKHYCQISLWTFLTNQHVMLLFTLLGLVLITLFLGTKINLTEPFVYFWEFIKELRSP